MKKIIFYCLSAVLVLSSCRKVEPISLSNAKEAVSGVSSSIDGPSFELKKDLGFQNQNLFIGAHQKIQQFTLFNGFTYPVKIERIEVSFYSNSSTGDPIPTGGMANLSIFKGQLQISYTLGLFLTDGRTNYFNGDNEILQPGQTIVLSEFSGLQNPPFSFFSKMKVVATNTVTGENIFSNLTGGQIVTVN